MCEASPSYRCGLTDVLSQRSVDGGAGISRQFFLSVGRLDTKRVQAPPPLALAKLADTGRIWEVLGGFRRVKVLNCVRNGVGSAKRTLEVDGCDKGQPRPVGFYLKPGELVDLGDATP